ncbi:MAG: molybdenum cofactor biosynthesis protein MoaE [Gammaproteobacteria bacterium]|nr:MAG: molybdenum cofactor biosynthesis protein MoaE [Gammaproteobacteria bacterium]
MKVEIFNKPYDPWQEAKKYQDDCLEPGKHGAMTLFVGTMRDLNEGDAVISMTLEHYTEMTQKHLEQITEDAKNKFDIIDVLLMHRVGQVFPSDSIVCVAVWSEHRAAAYDANRFVMEDLKAKAPFWKKEVLEDKQKENERWVEKNTPV